jgi:GT2 family glycosyltransferase
VIELFEADPGLASASGPYSFYDLDGLLDAVSRGWFLAARPLHWLGGFVIVGGNFAIRRDVLRKMGGFDRSIEFYGEDVDVARRARRHGGVAFSSSLVMPTSARRMARQGFARTAGIYAANYLSIVTRGRPLTRAYLDVR